MKISVEEYIRLGKQGRLDEIDRAFCGKKRGGGCKKCGVEINPDITGRQQTSEGILCDDCYFEELGEEIEKHPIINPLRMKSINKVGWSKK